MKTHAKSTQPGKSATGKSQRRRGVALLTVLTIISLSTILILTFFQLAQNEMSASASYNDGLEAQQVAEEAVNLVIKQIRAATAGSSSNAWASQPGAIRTWDQAGGFLAGYKLYSDDVMVEPDQDKLVADDYKDLVTWSQSPARFVDLNEPVIRGDKVYYPILDPTARALPEWNTNLGEDDQGVEGFFLEEYDKDKQRIIFMGNTGQMMSGPLEAALLDVKPKDNVTRRPLPMPAMWIYQLKDGTLGHLDSGEKFVAAQGGNRPTNDNPIVARFAFWTDDETCKLNPNIHAGGSAWSTPFAAGNIDRESFARFQPAQHEWQRYPGHPASTHIAPVLAPGIPDITYNKENMEKIFGVVPRVVGGGSMSGTRKVNPDNAHEANGLIADKDRLYASLDEFLLEPGYKGESTTIRDPNDFPDPDNRFGGVKDTKEMQEQIERSKFFLSVVSRAPEVTLFNTPRISIWPTYWDGAPGFTTRRHTVFDKLIRFCGEVGKERGGTDQDRFRYHFQRYNADSVDDDYERIVRNKQLIEYLDELTKTNVPGFGKSFADKYGQEERLQIITEIFDYIRCTNLHDDTLYGEDWEEAFTPQSANSEDVLTYTNGRSISANERTTHKGHGQVTPLKISISGVDTKGLGRFYTMAEVGVLVVACGQANAPGGGDNWHGAGVTRYENTGMTQFQMGFVESPDVRYQYGNIPPLPTGSNGPRRDDNEARYNSTWPNWLQELAEKELDSNGIPHPKIQGGQIVGKTGKDGEDLLDIAFEPDNWNWQLAWLSSEYESRMRSNMAGNKYQSSDPYFTKEVSDQMHLDEDQVCVQAALVWNMFCPSSGWVPINPDMLVDIQIEDMTFPAIGSSNVKFGWTEDLSNDLDPSMPSDLAWATNRQQTSWHDRFYGGVKPLTFMMTGSGNQGANGALNTPGVGTNGRVTPVDLRYEEAQQYNKYPWVTKPFKVGKEVSMEAGKVTMNIFSAGTNTKSQNMTENSAPQSRAERVQTLDVPFPSFSCLSPVLPPGRPGYINEFGATQSGKVKPIEYWSLTVDGANKRPGVAPRGRMSKANGHHGSLFQNGYNEEGVPDGHGDVVRSVAVRHGDFRVVAAKSQVIDTSPSNYEDNLFHYHADYDTKKRMAHNFIYTPGVRYAGADEPLWTKDRTPTRGDEERWLVSIPNDTHFAYHRNRMPYLFPYDRSNDVQLYGDFDNGMGNTIDGPYINKPDEGNIHSLFQRTDPNAAGLGLWELARDYGDYPYFVRDWLHESATPAYFSPNRIICSPGQFGSLPVGTTQAWTDKNNKNHDGQPWRTLQFRPQVHGGIYEEEHPGSGEPLSDSGRWSILPDHLFLDLFWMPVVEPYAISEPLSTGGKVNLNYQILPFHHIKRNTALRGVFKSEYMLCIPNKHTRDYKVGIGRGTGYNWKTNRYGGSLQDKSLRTVIMEDYTLYQFEKRFANNQIFKTASEICDVHLVPQEIGKRMAFYGSKSLINTTDFEGDPPEQVIQAMSNGDYWSDHAAVGDNARERPYANIYGRITTKSNTFKVHYRAQVLRKAQKQSNPDEWDDNVDQVVAEYRGSSIVERYVDPNDEDIPDYATRFGDAVETIDKFYRFRVMHPTRFAP